MVRSQTHQPDRDDDDPMLVALEVAGRMLWALVKLTARMAVWAVAFPMLSVPMLLAVYVNSVAGHAAGILVATVSGMLLVGWSLLWPASFRTMASDRLRARWRAWSVYRRRWDEICALHALTATLDEQLLVPKLAKLNVGRTVDVVIVRMLLGQSLTGWRNCAEALAHAFGARDVQIRGLKPGWLELTVRRDDALADPAPVPEPVEPVDLTAVPVGIVEDGHRWTLAVLGRHILAAAATGAGKSTLLWALFYGLGPAIRDGLVQLWVIDPKGGMEFGIGQPLFTRFAYADPQAMLDLLRDAVAVMQDRAQRLRGVTRLHTPTVAEPLLLVVVDEIAALTAYGVDRKLRGEIEQALGMLLSQGRAVGVSVLACTQDPSKEVLAMRQLFPTKVALRLSEASQVPMVLGPGAREAGALCEQIRDDTPGVGYVVEDGHAGVVRIRIFHVTDPDISHLIAVYRPRRDTPPCSGDIAA
jgi:S-DNA-T family DNA segregation ATPase FtsK/SpoIIIE